MALRALRGDHKVEPVGIGLRPSAVDNFDFSDRSSAAQIRASAGRRHGRRYSYYQAGVHGVGKVNGGGTRGQFDNFARGGEHIDFVGKQIGFNMLEEFQRIAGLLSASPASPESSGSPCAD